MNAADVASLRMVADAIKLSQHILAREPRQLRAQLAGRVENRWREPASERTANGRIELIPVSATLSSPGGVRGVTLTGHRKAVRSVDGFPDGRRIASISEDATIRIWDLDRGIQAAEIPLPAEFVSHRMRVRISPDGSLIAACGGRDMAVWRWPSLAQQGFWRTDGTLADLTWSPLDELLTVTHKRTIQLWHLDQPEPIAVLRGHEASRESGPDAWYSPVPAIAVTPDATRIIAVSVDKRAGPVAAATSSLCVWRRNDSAAPNRFFDTNVEMRVVEGRELFALAVAPDGRRVVTGSDAVPLLWDLTSKSPPTILTTYYGPEHDYAVEVVGFTVDGRFIIASDGPDLRVWRVHADYPTGSVAVWEGHSSSVTDIAVLADGSGVASSSVDHTVKLWNLGDSPGRVRGTTAGDPVEWIGFDPAGRLRFATVRYLDTDDGAEWESAVHWGSERVDWTYRIDWIEECGASLLVAVGNDIELLTPPSGTRRRLGFQPFALLALAPDRRRLVSLGGRDGKLRLWSIEQTADPMVLEYGKGSPRSVAWSDDGNWIMVGMEDGSVRLWRSEHPSATMALAVGEEPCAFVSATAGDRFVVMDALGAVSVVSPVAAAVRRLGECSNPMALNVAGNLIAAVGAEGVAVWDGTTMGQLVGMPAGTVRIRGVPHCGIAGHPMPALSLSSVGPWAAACSEASVHLWDLERGQKLSSFTADDELESCAFSEDGSRLAVGTVSGDVHLLEIRGMSAAG